MSTSINLGQAASIVIRHMRSAFGFYDDPITIAYGVGDEMGPGVDAHERRKAIEELATHGWSLVDFDEQVEARTSAKWSYMSGMSAWLGRGDEA